MLITHCSWRTLIQPGCRRACGTAGNFAPVGWATCDRQLLTVAQNTVLFFLLGTMCVFTRPHTCVDTKPWLSSRSSSGCESCSPTRSSPKTSDVRLLQSNPAHQMQRACHTSLSCTVC